MNFAQFCRSVAKDADRARELGGNSPMPQSNKEKQEAFRARQAMLGATEVRGIFLPPDLHADLKEYARKLLAQSHRKDSK